MSALVTLSSNRVCLRQWRKEDQAPFAAMNSDPRVMEYFPSALSRAASNALIDRIQRHFCEHGFGLWAIEIPDVAPFIGFTGLAIPGFSAHFTPCVEIGWRLAFEHWGYGYATEAARLALGHAFGPLALAEVVSFTSTTNRRSRAVIGCAAIPPRISIIPPYLRGIHCEGTCFIGSNPGHIPECRQRFQFTADEMQSKPLCGLRMPQPAKAFRAMRQIANIQTAMMVPSVARPLMVQPAA